MPDDSTSGRGAHGHGQPMPYGQALEADLLRRAEQNARPDIVEYERLKVERERQRRAGLKGAKGKAEVYGPPNPFRPGRPKFKAD